MLVLVSRAEGAPLVVMEAMSRGRAVAVTDGCGGVLDAITNTQAGIVAPTGDMAGLAAKLGAIWRDGKSLARMGRAAHASAQKHFALDALAPRYDALVRAATAHPSGLPATPQRSAIAHRWKQILAALEILGPCDPSPLAREWAIDHGVPEEWMRPRELPGLLGPADELLLSAVTRLADLGCRRIALYGAGRHTGRIERAIRRSESIVAITDDRAGTDGGPGPQLLGLPVIKPESLPDHAIDAVIVSSDEHEAEMLARAKTWAGAMPVVGLYGDSH
jgi:hypothetical protein